MTNARSEMEGVDPGVPGALGKTLAQLRDRVGIEALDRLWIFPPFRRGRREQGSPLRGALGRDAARQGGRHSGIEHAEDQQQGRGDADEPVAVEAKATHQHGRRQQHRPRLDGLGGEQRDEACGDARGHEGVIKPVRHGIGKARGLQRGRRSGRGRCDEPASPRRPAARGWFFCPRHSSTDRAGRRIAATREPLLPSFTPNDRRAGRRDWRPRW